MDKTFSEVIESEIPKDAVLISVGLPGSWKSPVTEQIARMKGFQILRSDILRLEVLKEQDIFEKRKYFCDQEVVLNRRLAPKLYLGVISITDDQGARISE